MTVARQVLVVGLGVVLLAGCSTGSEQDEPPPRVVQLGAPGETPRELTEDEAAALGSAEHTEADVRFVQGMIPHHAQALEMTALVPDRTQHDGIPLLALRMETAQRDEIDLMRRWLEARDEAVPEMSAGAHLGHGAGQLMPGMLTADEMAQLEQARGAEFDRLFLQFMIRHHEGALVMVEELFSDGGAQETEVFQLAQHVDSDQRIEIARMKGLLAETASAATP